MVLLPIYLHTRDVNFYIDRPRIGRYVYLIHIFWINVLLLIHSCVSVLVLVSHSLLLSTDVEESQTLSPG